MTERFNGGFAISDGCWEWKRFIKKEGYGTFSIGGKQIHAHRASYLLFKGPIEAEGMEVCHSCDNRKCVNPAHLWLGTRSQNQMDCIFKNRRKGPRGELSPKAKLTNEQADEIRGLAGKTGTPTIAKLYGISRRRVRAIISGQAYTDHVVHDPRTKL